jgi:selenide,water dikinase
VANSGARPGDKIILTKPLGTGIINTALKAGAASGETVDRVIRSMAALNDKASELMQETGVNACTDITGFGLMGHSVQSARNSGIGIKYSAAAVPVFDGTEEFVGRGLVPGGLGRNRDFYADSITIADEVPASRRDVLFDPQTSGGLLICLPTDRAHALLGKLHGAGIVEAAIIGEVVEGPEGKITVAP